MKTNNKKMLKRRIEDIELKVSRDGMLKANELSLIDEDQKF